MDSAEEIIFRFLHLGFRDYAIATFALEFLQLFGLERRKVEDFVFVVVSDQLRRRSGGGGGGGGRLEGKRGGDGFLDLELESEVEVGLEDLRRHELAALLGGDEVEVEVVVWFGRSCSSSRCHWRYQRLVSEGK